MFKKSPKPYFARRTVVPQGSIYWQCEEVINRLLGRSKREGKSINFPPEVKTSDVFKWPERWVKSEFQLYLNFFSDSNVKTPQLSTNCSLVIFLRVELRFDVVYCIMNSFSVEIAFNYFLFNTFVNIFVSEFGIVISSVHCT